MCVCVCVCVLVCVRACGNACGIHMQTKERMLHLLCSFQALITIFLFGDEPHRALRFGSRCQRSADDVYFYNIAVCNGGPTPRTCCECKGIACVYISTVHMYVYDVDDVGRATFDMKPGFRHRRHARSRPSIGEV